MIFPVTRVSTAKSLGVTIDDNLDLGSHVENIIKKVSSGFETIKRVRHLIPQSDLIPNISIPNTPSFQIY